MWTSPLVIAIIVGAGPGNAPRSFALLGAQHPLSRPSLSAEVIAHAVWLYFRFPLSLRMVEDLLAASTIIVSHETVRRWSEKFGRDFTNKICWSIAKRAVASLEERRIDFIVTPESPATQSRLRPRKAEVRGLFVAFVCAIADGAAGSTI